MSKLNFWHNFETAKIIKEIWNMNWSLNPCYKLNVLWMWLLIESVNYLQL